jgi:hypothetical protein
VVDGIRPYGVARAPASPTPMPRHGDGQEGADRERRGIERDDS